MDTQLLRQVLLHRTGNKSDSSIFCPGERPPVMGGDTVHGLSAKTASSPKKRRESTRRDRATEALPGAP